MVSQQAPSRQRQRGAGYRPLTPRRKTELRTSVFRQDREIVVKDSAVNRRRRLLGWEQAEKTYTGWRRKRQILVDVGSHE